MRLAKLLAHSGVASRRAAERLIEQGRVTVGEDTVLDPARAVSSADDVRVDGRRVEGPERRVVYALHKPLGVISTAHDTHGRKTVTDLIDEPELRLYPVGRLDADSSGLILLTNDGELANLLTHPRYEVPKTYRVRVAGGRVQESALRKLREGVELADGPTAPAQVEPIATQTIEITIREGRNRQVRRMCEAVGHPVQELTRIAFGPLRLQGLAPGAHRLLAQDEVASLRAMCL